MNLYTRLLILFSLLVIVAAPAHAFDVKGYWRASEGECQQQCRFLIMDNIDKQNRQALFIIFPPLRKGEPAKAHPFRHNQGEEWVILTADHVGSLFLRGGQFVSLSHVTYRKLNETEIERTTP